MTESTDSGSDNPTLGGAARLAFPVATSMRAALAFLDGRVSDAHELMRQLRERSDLASPWTFAIKALVSFAGELIKVADAHNGPDQMWSDAELIAGMRALTTELVPPDHRDATSVALDQYAAWTAQISRRITLGGKPVAEHPWTADVLGSEGQAWAALMLLTWLTRQPQVIGDTAIRLREDILVAALSWQNAVDNPEPEPFVPVSDHDARRLLLAAYEGENLFDVPTNPDLQKPRHLNILSAVRQWIYEHPDISTPTGPQLTQLRRHIEIHGLGLPADPSRHALTDVIPADTPPPTGHQIDTAELLALRLLHAATSIDGEADPDTITDAMNGIDQLGEIGYRLAWLTIQDAAAPWIDTLLDHARPTSSQLVPGLEALVDRIVPESKRHATTLAYLPVIAKAVDTGSGDLYPVPTSDVEADLWLITAFAAWCATQPANDPPRARQQLAASITYLQRTDRATTDSDLGQLAAALPLLHATLTETDVARLRGLITTPGIDTTRILRYTSHMATAAHDAARGDQNALHHIQRLNTILQAIAATRTQHTPKSTHTTSREEHNQRRQRERQLRKRKKK
ncbi:hypothetical protein [Nocardia wallacei]|uniref:hypothetical protein n=1 Tax=Nocardia wallacei TaxID=480035 RepID=UPI002457F098|nr:hypothetical protein [Nocardia wallacei]